MLGFEVFDAERYDVKPHMSKFTNMLLEKPGCQIHSFLE
jgi:hypothetical protein